MSRKERDKNGNPQLSLTLSPVQKPDTSVTPNRKEVVGSDQVVDLKSVRQQTVRNVLIGHLRKAGFLD
ncbi:hypothetical protein FRZ61_02120 [Hypericibacter adhaerens]|uniref:Uncharacterized protein n=1 Tax=Hypericibacter adhaerens TaxID=2602016 RepID=A0A5J6MU79_9PROT|nr:hypothetical protein [Hypericibacter adhaerens]QEX20295.1 hypothetical protein FRZ61_02120 [Hypericibacter adhaerens]